MSNIFFLENNKYYARYTPKTHLPEIQREEQYIFVQLKFLKIEHPNIWKNVCLMNLTYIYLYMKNPKSSKSQKKKQLHFLKDKFIPLICKRPFLYMMNIFEKDVFIEYIQHDSYSFSSIFGIFYPKKILFKKNLTIHMDFYPFG